MFSASSEACVRLARAVYAPGDVVAGEVVLSLSKPSTFTSVTVHFEGTRECHDEIKTTFGNTEKTETFKAKGFYFEDTLLLFQATNGAEQFAAGEHRFPFKYELPSDLPDSFEAILKPDSFEAMHKPGLFEAMLKGDKAFARIRYLVKLEVTNPDVFRSTIREERLFKVCAPIREDPRPVGKAADADISGFFCCGSRGTIRWSAKLDSDTVFPDDVVVARISVDSRECQAPVKSVSARISRCIAIEIKDHSGLYIEPVCKKSVPVIIEAGSQKDTTVELRLPRAGLQPSVGVEIFRCTYKLDIELEVPRSFNPEIGLPLKLALSRADTTEKEGSLAVA